ncbi:NAD(P)H-dependent oxidoreductase [Hydrogenophaga sp. 5NK40-0174]|uniref:FMN-dependent NADH-azoreductase n=1 Tax=Hydrogenophaga sp. 5NK40-0174 TaxID=3127649 RepID=UPI003106741F
MSQTLVVRYTPREHSNTAKLLSAVMARLGSQHQPDVLDLVATPVQQHSSATINALLKRNFGGQTLSAAEQAVVNAPDSVMQRLLHADRIVLAFPFYNFSVPAAVKAWLDAVIQKGKTFDISGNGQFEGLCHGKKALILMTSGGDYGQPATEAMNLATPLVQNCFSLLGVESRAVSAMGMDVYPGQSGTILEKAVTDAADALDWMA